MNLTGKSAAPGIVVGSLYIYNKKYVIPEENFVKEEEKKSHHDRYLQIKDIALNELQQLKSSMQKIDPVKAEIFSAHKEIVDDITINEEIPARILNDSWAGDWAIYQVYETVLTVLRNTADPLISERAEDFEDVRALLLRLWHGQKNDDLSLLKEPVIIVSCDLKPSDTANLDKNKVLAILTESGGITSHSAIIARSYGIPAILGIKGLLNFVKQGQIAAVNATNGTVVLDPDIETLEEYRKNNAIFRQDKETCELFQNKEGITSCGVKIDIGVNIVNPQNDDEINAVHYTDFVGLFRTEFLFLGRNTLPSEEEQFTCYRKVLENFGQKPVVLRTLDIGADKIIPCMEIKREDNPFLGNRGIRFCLSNPEIFKTQIRAALRASVYGNLHLMFPMISSLDDIRKVKEIIINECTKLEKEGIPYNNVKIGIMIEVPSIALISDLVAKEVDFASIGSNDLCQYLCAADRINSDCSVYYQSYHPAMFRIIKKISTSFVNEGKPLSICGELGSDPLVAPVLIALGLRKFSMGAASIAAVKRAITLTTIEKSKKIAEKIMDFTTADEIENYLKTAIL